MPLPRPVTAFVGFDVVVATAFADFPLFFPVVDFLTAVCSAARMVFFFGVVLRGFFAVDFLRTELVAGLLAVVFFFDVFRDGALVDFVDLLVFFWRVFFAPARFRVDVDFFLFEADLVVLVWRLRTVRDEPVGFFEVFDFLADFRVVFLRGAERDDAFLTAVFWPEVLREPDFVCVRFLVTPTALMGSLRQNPQAGLGGPFNPHVEGKVCPPIGGADRKTASIR